MKVLDAKKVELKSVLEQAYHADSEVDAIAIAITFRDYPVAETVTFTNQVYPDLLDCDIDYETTPLKDVMEEIACRLHERQPDNCKDDDGDDDDDDDEDEDDDDDDEDEDDDEYSNSSSSENVSEHDEEQKDVTSAVSRKRDRDNVLDLDTMHDTIRSLKHMRILECSTSTDEMLDTLNPQQWTK